MKRNLLGLGAIFLCVNSVQAMEKVEAKELQRQLTPAQQETVRDRWKGQEAGYLKAVRRLGQELSTTVTSNQGEKIGEFNAKSESVTTYFAEGRTIVLNYEDFIALLQPQVLDNISKGVVTFVPELPDVELQAIRARWKGQEAGFFNGVRRVAEDLSTTVTNNQGEKIGEFNSQTATVTTYFADGGTIVLSFEEFIALLEPQALGNLDEGLATFVPQVSDAQLQALKARWKGQEAACFNGVRRVGHGLSTTVTNSQGEKIGEFNSQTMSVTTYFADKSTIVLSFIEFLSLLQLQMLGSMDTDLAISIQSELKARWNGQEADYFEAAKRAGEGLSTTVTNSRGEKVGEINAEKGTVTTYFADGCASVLSFMQFVGLLQPKMQLTNTQQKAIKTRWNEESAGLLKGLLRAKQGLSTSITNIQGQQIGQIDISTATVTTYFADGSTLMLGFEQFFDLMQPEINVQMQEEFNNQLELLRLN